MLRKYSLPGLLVLSLLPAGLSAQDIGSLSVFVGGPNRGNAAAEAAFQARSAEARRTVGQGLTMVTGFVDYRQPLTTTWLNSANWWRTSVVASEAVQKQLPVLSVGLADGVTADPVGQMLAIGNPADTVYGPIFEAIVTGFRNSGFNKLYLRIGWEHNGEWYPWTTANPDKTPNPVRTAAFLAAYRRVADLVHNISGITVTTVWSPNFERLTPAQVAATYPGDEYVDVIAPDMYSPIWNAIPEKQAEGLQLAYLGLWNTANYRFSGGARPLDTASWVTMLNLLAGANPVQVEAITAVTATDAVTIVDDPGATGNYQPDPARRYIREQDIGGRISKLNANAAGDYVQYLVPVPNPGRYDVKVRVKTHFSRGQYQLLVDGTAQGPAQDFYAATQEYIVVDLGQREFATAGAKPFRFVVVGRNPESTGHTLVVDYIDLTPHRREVETLTSGAMTDGTTLFFDPAASDGAAERFDADAPGDFVEYIIPVIDPGTYSVKVRVKKHNARGQFQLRVEGAYQGLVQDLYTPYGDPNPWVELDLGTKTFGLAGEKVFRFTVTGRNPNSLGYWLAFDTIALTRQ